MEEAGSSTFTPITLPISITKRNVCAILRLFWKEGGKKEKVYCHQKLPQVTVICGHRLSCSDNFLKPALYGAEITAPLSDKFPY